MKIHLAAVDFLTQHCKGAAQLHGIGNWTGPGAYYFLDHDGMIVRGWKETHYYK